MQSFHGLLVGTVLSCVINPQNFIGNNPKLDRQQICNYYNLSPRQAVFARTTMNISALVFAGFLAHVMKIDKIYKSTLEPLTPDIRFFKSYIPDKASKMLENHTRGM